MVIKNKDGSVFRLRGPNKIMRDQQLWNDKEKVYVHNITGDEIQMEVEERVIKPISDMKIIDTPEIKVIEKPTKPDIKTQSILDKLNEAKRPAYCLPAIEESFIDPLYNETKKNYKFGEKFVFELITKEQTGFNYEFWTDVDNLPLGSVIMVRGERQWWRVISIQEIKPGKLVQCCPSSFTPSFEK
jgi:hypothetical protein